MRAAWCPQWQGPKSEHLLALTAAASVEAGTAALNPAPGGGLVQLWLVQTSAEEGAKGVGDMLWMAEPLRFFPFSRLMRVYTKFCVVLPLLRT